MACQLLLTGPWGPDATGAWPLTIGTSLSAGPDVVTPAPSGSAHQVAPGLD